MKIRYFLTILIAISIFISSCDEINKLINPSEEYLIDKTISASSSEQIIETGTEFKMIFPANSVKGDFTLKIKKEGSYPTFSIPNAKLGSNTYRIKFSGNTAFATPVKIIINYDKSQIPDGKTAAEFIQAYIYANGNWKLATYQLDEPNSKIIISISNLETPKTNKDTPELQGDGDLVIGSGQKSINDSGQNDNPLAKFKYLDLGIVFDMVFDNGDIEKEYNMDSPGYGVNYTWSKISWSGNYFTIKYEKIDINTTPLDSTIIEISGEVRQIDNDVINNEITIIKLNYDKYSQSRVTVSDDIIIIKNSFVLYNFKLTIPSKSDPVNWPCSEWITGNNIGKYLKDIKSYYYRRYLVSDQTYKITEKFSKSYSFEQSSQIHIQFNAI
jgi:hypothetical protein